MILAQHPRRPLATFPGRTPIPYSPSPILLLPDHCPVGIEAQPQSRGGDPPCPDPVADPVGTAHYRFKSFSCNTYASPRSVDSKPLTQSLSPLDATLTRIIGGGRVVMVNKESDEDWCPRATFRKRGLSLPPVTSHRSRGRNGHFPPSFGTN